MKTAFIVNLVAGRGRSGKLWSKIEPVLRENHDFKVYYTRGPGDAVKLAGTAREEGATTLVAVGGDGTVCEVVNGMDFSGSVLGVLPAGTGNDLCRSLNYPADPFTVAENLFQWQPRAIDVGKTGSGYFANVIGVGFDAQVAHDVNNRFKYLNGAPAYLASILKNLVTYRNTPVEVEYDGNRWEGKALLIAVGNGNCYGGGIKIVPPAVVNDGCFHLCLAKDVSKFDALRILPSMFNGGHVGHRQVEIIEARHVTITSSVPLMVQADGEITGTLPLTLELLPGALRVLAP